MIDEKGRLLRDEYISRINIVQDYIESNISEEFSLNELSRIANFSPYHFHRIFYMMTRETLFQYIQRIRLEKAALLLLANRKTAITQIALECGFSNQASFAKAFKKYFNTSASKIRNYGSIKRNMNFEIESNIGKVSSDITCYNDDIPFIVDIRMVQAIGVVYIRHTGPYKKNKELFNKLFEKLHKWASDRELIHSAETKWLTLCHDNPELTQDNKLRISVCMTVSENVEVSGEVGKLTISGGKYAVGHFEINEDQYQDAWNILYSKWLPESGYQPDDRIGFELYPSISTDNSETKHIVDIYIPIKPL